MSEEVSASPDRAVFRRYAAGMGLLASGALLTRILGPHWVGGTVSFMGAALTSVTLLVEVYALAHAAWETSLGKLLGLLLGTMIGAAAMALSSDIVNQATGLDPGNFSYAVAFIAPLTAGYLIIVAAAIVALAGMLWIVVKTLGDAARMGWARGQGKRFAPAKPELDGMRFIAIIVLLFFALTVWGLGERPYNATLAATARGFVYQLEFYANDRCARLGERARRLNDEMVAIGHVSGGKLQFDLRNCPLGLGSQPALVMGQVLPSDDGHALGERSPASAPTLK